MPLIHEEIKGKLRRKIASQWRAGKRLPPIKQLAAEMRAGQSNTHRAIKELAAEGLLASRPGRGTFVCAATKTASPSVPRRAMSVRQILVIRTRTSEGLIDRMIDGFRDELAQDLREKIAVDWFDHFDLARWPEADVIVAINPNNLGDYKVAPHQALLVIDTAITEQVSAAKRFDTVFTDSVQGSQLAGQWMRRIACPEVCFVGRSNPETGKDDPTSAARLLGFEAGFGKSIAPQHQLHVSHYATENGALAASRYMRMRNRPDGVFCASDDLALGFMHGALGHGLHPGRDYQLVGFNGQSRGQEMTCGPLTTVAAPAALMGRTAADLLRSRLEEPDQPTRRIMLGCAFIEGVTARRHGSKNDS